MHHEVLLALSGCPGNAFSVSSETGLFEVTPGLPFVHPSEVDLLNRICRLGTYYLQLREFISEQNASIFHLPGHQRKSDDFTPQRQERSGLYLKALAGGIDLVLDDYRQTLVQVEQKCIQDPHLPFSYLQSSFEEYQFLLPSLDGCVKHIYRNKLHGCQILSYLNEQCSCGVPIVQRSYERILCQCHGVFYKQLSAWMLHGLLMDERGEFFIQTVDEPPTEVQQEQVARGDSQPVQRVGTKSSIGQTTNKFTINHSLTPSYLPMRVIEKILFVGEAVQIFQTQAHSKHGLSVSLTEAGSQLRTDQFRFGRVLVGLQEQPLFQLRDFESAIDSIRDCVAEHLWKLLVENSNLVDHLHVIKDFFLLGRGELFLALVDLTNTFMSLPPTSTTQHDVNIAFQQAMLKVGMENEDLMKQFKLVVTLPPHKGAGAAWNFLGLTQTVEWPLHILFTPTMLEKYNSVFKFLLSLRRAQIALQQTWALMMQHRQKVDELRDIWELRTHMGFLIDNLQYYVQVDVLETQFSQLLEKINSTQDFESIKHAHENFVTTLQSQLFFKLPAAAHCLQEIMELCYSFSSLLHSLLQRHENLSFSQKDKAQIERTMRDFKRQSSLFFQVVSSVKNHHSAPHLAQLLLRVDYNKFFSTRNPLATSQHKHS